MKSGFVHSRTRVFLFVLFFLSTISLFLSATAIAFIYDDFSDAAIDTSKWDTVDSKGLFKQSDGRLIFSAARAAGTLKSTRTFRPGLFSMEFYDFTSTNMELHGSHKGSFAALGLITADGNFVRIIRCQNSLNGKPYGVFEVNFMVGKDFKVYYVPTSITLGRLGMNYDGTNVTFYYDDGSGWKNTGWREAGTSNSWSGVWNPGWTSDPQLFIRGYDLTYSTSFKVDNVEYSPVP